jgi:hypothetical protein
MHSSTSSSSTRVPRGNWLGAWCSVLVIVVLVSGGWELFVRERGLGDTAVANTAEIWIRERERASQLGDDAVILVGASRMQMGFDLQVLKQFTNGNPVQLAVSASPFLPIFEHLANDASITGTVIVSFTVSDLMLSTKETRSERWPEAYDEYRAGTVSVFYQPFEDSLRQLIDSNLVSFESDARPQQLDFGRRNRFYLRTLPDRSQHADYSKVDRELAYQRRIERVLAGAAVELRDIPDFDDRIRHLESLAMRIVGRGGEVIFVRLPSTMRIREIEDTRYPRSVYWDTIAAQVSLRTIHYDDHPELSEFDFPDGVHVDVSDQAAYTEKLAKLLFGDIPNKDP